MSALRIGLLGGVPSALGGGGLERQMARTAAALERRGHAVLRVEATDAEFDVLHAFGAEGNVQFALEHWTRRPAPLVISPVLVSSPGRDEFALRLASRIVAPATHAALRRRALMKADRLVAITAYEATILRRLGGRGMPIDVVSNGVDPVAPGPAQREPGYVLLLGTVSARKRQHQVLEALAGQTRVVVAGPFSGTAAGELRAWETQARRPGVDWLGEVRDPGRIARLLTDAAALVQLSRAEVQSLAVLEALAAGTPAIASGIPSHRELAAAHPGWVRIAAGPEDLAPAFQRLLAQPPDGPRPAIPTWDDVAVQLELTYRRAREIAR